MCFSDSNTNIDDVDILFEDTQGSDSDMVQYIHSPTYHPSPSTDVSTVHLTPVLGSTARSSTVCLTPEPPDLRINPLSEIRWRDSDSDY